jgi:hypothetical protein
LVISLRAFWPLVADAYGIARALRKLSPPYHGPAVTLFRGATEHGWRKGFSWSASIDEARQWVSPYEGALVQALVQPAAIICKIEYAEPFSEQEKAEILGEHPGSHFPDFSAEQEYVVDPAGITQWQFLPLS